MNDKSKYDDIEIPEELDSIINNALKEGKCLRRKNITAYIVKKTLMVLVVFVISVGSLVNISPVFAKTMYEIPLIGDFCQVLTLREYHFKDDIKYIDVKIPKIENTGKTDLEKRVNLEIQKAINKCVKESDLMAKDYFEAFVETGGKPKEFTPIGITVDYEVKCINEQYISFVVSQTQTAFSAYNNTLYYNIDLETSKVFTLKDWYGNQYKQVVADSVENTIDKWSSKQRNLLWKELSIYDLITENTNFYLNQNNQIVVVFEKYEVAAGAAGSLEFLI
ncbi:MAG: DUF3298 domain-containing protein [Coprobacillus sp.]